MCGRVKNNFRIAKARMGSRVGGMNGDTCEKCRWWVMEPWVEHAIQTGAGGFVVDAGCTPGTCHRYAPKPLFPKTASGSFCGEFSSLVDHTGDLPGVAPMPIVNDWSVTPAADGTQAQERP